MLQKWHLTKSVINESCAPNFIFFNEKKNWNDSDDYWHRKLTLKVRFLNGRWSAKDLLQWGSAIYHSIKLGFEGQVAKKFLNGIYCACTGWCTVHDHALYCKFDTFSSVIMRLVPSIKKKAATK